MITKSWRSETKWSLERKFELQLEWWKWQLQVVARQCLSQRHFPLAIWWFPIFAWLRNSHGSDALLTHASLCSCSFMCCIPCRLDLASVVSVFIVRCLWLKHKKHKIWKRVNATKLHPTLSRLLVLNIPNANVDIWQLAAADLLRGFASRINQTLFKQRNRLTRLELSTFFLYSQGDILKPSVSYVFHWGGILNVSFCNERANSKLRTWYFVQAKRSFHLSRWEKIGNVSWSKNFMSLQLGRIFLQFWRTHAGSSSKMELVMETFCLHWKLRADVPIFAGSAWDLCFWAKTIGFDFFKIFHAKSRCWAPATSKRLLNLTRFLWQIVAFCARPLCIWIA